MGIVFIRPRTEIIVDDGCLVTIGHLSFTGQRVRTDGTATASGNIHFLEVKYVLPMHGSMVGVW